MVRGWGGVVMVVEALQEADLFPVSTPQLDPTAETPHPLVTEGGGEPVNYRRIPHFEQWFIRPAALPSAASAFHRRRDASSIRTPIADRYAIAAVLAPFKCFPPRGRGLLHYLGSALLSANAGYLTGEV